MDNDTKRKLVAERERAALAQQLFDNPLWDEAWEIQIEGIWNAWRKSDPGDTESRERAYMALKAVENTRKHIKTIITTGKMAEQSLEEDK